MSAREAALEAYFAKTVRLIGGLTEKLAPTTKGIPDRIVLMPGGRIELVELKTDTGHLSPAQSLWSERAHALGTKVTVLYGKEQIDAWARRTVQRDDPPVGKGGRPRKNPGPKSKIDGPVVVRCHSCARERKLPTRFAADEWIEDLHRGHNTEVTMAAPAA